MDERQLQAWSTPSWRIEPKYCPRVLIGNWLEERKKFIRASGLAPISTYMRDYVHFPDHKLDQLYKRHALSRMEGLPYKHLIVHNEEPKHRNFISAYDDHFNHHGHNPDLPLLRQWNVQKLAWLPEKSDFPLVEPPSNYGLFEQRLKRWSASVLDPMKSVYTVSYVRPTFSTPSLWNLTVSSHSPQFQ
ncbi:uncharacterized protein C1orf158 homolog [Tachyglossus aculeatus]|uniref:uncharacterized protein C1orf158 homolog n=1 Tax=Tachyglossus aculeatus TaxID=9261 RepID=UPI0018F43CE8|nr:uncharacterized protein C1orf158 homolog [Tachyglossus aculeatus]